MASDDLKAIDRLRLAEADRRKLLDQIERSAAAEHDRLRSRGLSIERRGVRVRVNMPAIVVDMVQPNGASARISVLPRNLSTRGMSFMHGQFVYDRSRLIITLPTLDGERVMISGTVMRCRHVQGLVHEVGVQFDKPINVRMFVEVSPDEAKALRAESASKSTSSSHGSANEMLGEALVIDDFEMDRKLLGMRLQKLGLVPTLAANGNEASEALNETAFDLIICDYDLGPENGLDIVRRLLNEGVSAPIFMASAEDRDTLLPRATEAGVRGLLTKPYNEQELRDAIEPIVSVPLRGNDTAVSSEPIHSELAEDANMRPLLEEFLGGIESMARRLHESHIKQDIKSLTSVVRILKGAGTSYGYPLLTVAAEDVLSVLGGGAGGAGGAGGDAEKLKAEVDELKATIKRLEL